MTTRSFNGQTVFDLALLTDVALDQDGDRIAVTVRRARARSYVSDIHVLSVADPKNVVKLGHGDALEHSPQWRPGGLELLFISDRGGSAQPWLLSDQGSRRQVASLPGPVSHVSWSAAGDFFTAIAPSPESFVHASETVVEVDTLLWRVDGLGTRTNLNSLWVCDPTSSSTRRISPPTMSVTTAAWSPDGARVVVAAVAEPGSQIEDYAQAFVIDVATCEVTALPELRGCVSDVGWATNGEILLLGIDEPGAPMSSGYSVFTTRDGRVDKLGGSDAPSAAGATIGDLFDVMSNLNPRLVISNDNRIFVNAAVRGSSIPHEITNDGEFRPLAHGDIVSTQISSAGGTTICVASVDGQPADLFAVSGDGLVPLTTFGRDSVPSVARPERHRLGDGDKSFDAWILRPEGADGPGPLVLHIHGGPEAAHGPVPWIEMLALAASGVSVIFANPFGSLGYGPSFSESLKGKWGSGDTDQLLEAVRWAISAGIADPDRVGVVGWSYGGFAALSLLTKHPDVFAAGVAEDPISDLVSWADTTDFPNLVNRRSAGFPAGPGRLSALIEASPMTTIDRITTPLLLMHGRSDLRVPAAQSEMVLNSLLRANKTAELVLFPDEAHSMIAVGRPDRRAHRISRIVDWFVEHLA